MHIPHTSWRSGPRVILAAAALLQISCASLQVPLTPVSFSSDRTLHSGGAGIELRIRPILSQDEYLDLFDDFLPEIGVVAFWVDVRNTRDNAVEIPPSSWRLETGGRGIHSLSVQDVFERYYDGRRIRMYTIGADGTARQNMERIAFKHGRIEPSTEHAGLVFFAIAPPATRGWNQGAVLRLGGIRLPDGSRVVIRIDISHASP
jgi:hypothetical protein